MTTTTTLAIDLTERGLLPDLLVRGGIRRLVRDRLREIAADDCEAMAEASSAFARQMSGAVVAPLPEKANEQHYEVPPEFFHEVLGPHRKYSCCYWGDGIESLETAEAAALATTCERAGLEDGQRLLELGCGWGAELLTAVMRDAG